MGFDLFKNFLFRNFLIVERTWEMLLWLLWSSKLSHFLVHPFQRGTLTENVTLLIARALSLLRWLWLDPCWISIDLRRRVFNLWHHLWSLARRWGNDLAILLLLEEWALPQIWCLFFLRWLRLLLICLNDYHANFVVILSIYHTFAHAVMRWLTCCVMSDGYCKIGRIFLIHDKVRSASMTCIEDITLRFNH